MSPVLPPKLSSVRSPGPTPASGRPVTRSRLDILRNETIMQQQRRQIYITMTPCRRGDNDGKLICKRSSTQRKSSPITIPAIAPPVMRLRLGCALEFPDPEPQLSEWALSTSEETVRRSKVYEYISATLRAIGQKPQPEEVVVFGGDGGIFKYFKSSDNALRR